MHKYIKLSAITIAPDRQRKEFKEEELRTLAESIQTKGLFHPIVLRVVGDSYILVAGERRLRAITDLWALSTPFNYDGVPVPPDSIPYASLADLSDFDIEEAELEENIQRTQLTWQERAAAHAKLHTLRTKQAESVGAPTHTVALTALEVRGSSEGIHQESTRREIILARHLDNPLVKSAKTAEEAFKALKKVETTAKHKELGAAVGRSFSADLHQVINGDSLEWMAEAAGEQFDVILTDPPYGMDADKFNDSNGRITGTHEYEDSPELHAKILTVCAAQFYRLAKPQAHLYWFCDIDKFFEAREQFSKAGWNVFRTPFIWYKPLGMRAPWPDQGPHRQYETILYAVKGKREIVKLRGDVIECNSDVNLGHSAQKPIPLLRELLSRSVFPGNSIFDPFVGTGSTVVAANEMKCRAVGIELSQASYGIAVGRLQGLKNLENLELAL